MQLGVLAGAQLFSGFGLKLAVLGASVAGGILLKGKQKPAGKLNDLRVSSSSYGRGIPIVEGTIRVTGNMMWATDFEEEKSYVTQKGKRKNGQLGKKKGKKGKATETYEYFANFAMGLCEGPVDAILRIWADNNLIYDKLNQATKDDPLVHPGFSTDSGSSGGKAGMKSPARKKGHSGDSSRFQFRFYNGSEDQLPDSYMVKKQGNNAVPFRGMAYLMFEHFALADFGNRTPTITAEVTMRGERKPVVRVFENIEPKTGWTQGYTGQEVLDPIRKRLYHLATRDGITYLRIYNMETFKEIKRIPIAPDSACPNLPQNFWSSPTELPTLIETYGTFVGVAHTGDLIFRYPQGNNYNPLIWVNPESMQVVRFWGRGGNIGAAEPIGFLAQAIYATPFVMNGSDSQATPEPVTAVETLFGSVAFFDTESPEPVIFANRYAINGLRAIAPGAYGTDEALVMMTSNMYTLHGRVYVAPVDQPLIPVTLMNNPQKLFYDFPTIEDDPNREVFISDITFASYCAGSHSIVMVATIQSGTDAWPDGIYLISLDQQTKERLWLYRVPGLGSGEGPSNLQIPTYLGGNQFCWLTGDTNHLKYITVDWRAETCTILSLPHGTVPQNISGTYYYSDLAALLYYTGDVSPDGEQNWVLASIDKMIQTETSVSDICYAMATRVGIPADRLDFSGMGSDEAVTGYMVENPTPAKEVLEELANVFMFDVIESDNLLKFKTRGTDSVVTIPQADLGIVESDFGTENEYYTETRQQEVELPERVNVSYIDPKNEYETGTEHYKRPLKPLSVMSSREVAEITLNMAMTPDRAKTLAQRILFAAWSERTTHTYALPRDYLLYEPSDVITIELENGETFTDRITDAEIGADLSMQITTVSQVAGSYRLTTTSSGKTGLIKLDQPAAPTVKPGVYDVPYLSDDDVDEGGKIVYYWGALAYDEGFKFGALIAQVPGGDADTEAFTNYDLIWGVTQGIVRPPLVPTELTDMDTTITLVPAFDFNASAVTFVWESIPDNEWPSEKNMVIIGNEVILFKEVEVLNNGAVTISHLIRGAKGTGEAAFQHVKFSEDWALVLPNTIQTADEFQDNLNISTWFSIQSQSYLPPAATKITKAMTGATRKPWQVGAIKRTNPAGGSIVLTWNRATRWGGALMNGNGDVALNEDSERYEIFLLKVAYDPMTWDPLDEDLFWTSHNGITTPTFTFTSAELAGYGLTSKSNINVVIYQISATVGRGFARGLSLPYNYLQA